MLHFDNCKRDWAKVGISIGSHTSYKSSMLFGPGLESCHQNRAEIRTEHWGKGDSPTKRRIARECIVAAFSRSRSETELLATDAPIYSLTFPWACRLLPFSLLPSARATDAPDLSPLPPALNLPPSPRSQSCRRSSALSRPSPPLAGRFCQGRLCCS